MTVINKKNAELTAANVMQRRLEAERDAQVQAERERREKAEAAMAAAQEQLQQEIEEFNAERKPLVQQNKEYLGKIEEKDEELRQQTENLMTKNEELNRQLSQTRQLYLALLEKERKRKEPTYERPDGEITMVNETAQIVWINLGSTDGVQRMMTFSVIDKDAVGVAQAEVKGSIEVTKVKGPHLAEARIVNQADLAKPIMEDDKIYSPSFRKGEKTRFALAGFMDIDGDGKSDRERIKSLITTNAGIVDAELLEDGTISGKMSVETKYLVKGERPDDKTNEKLISGFTTMTGEATKLGVQTITIQDLLDRMGYFPETRVVPLDRGGVGGSSRGQETERFRPRTPPRSAY
jgi:uncharacterized protein (UPF0305 family)